MENPRLCHHAMSLLHTVATSHHRQPRIDDPPDTRLAMTSLRDASLLVLPMTTAQADILTKILMARVLEVQKPMY